MAQKRSKRENVDGWVILDKPVGMSSTEAVGKVRWLLNAAKGGHAGTLDPLASGCLPIALGEATKTVPVVMDGRKIYAFTVRWGAETETDDAEGEVVATSDLRPSQDAIEAALPAFRGAIMQTPPRFSAIKVDGERAYDLARDGEAFELAARPVEIDRLDLVGMPDADTAEFEAECGKGTYVRAVARDLARLLGTRGHVVALRRLRVGPFGEEHMISLESLEELRHNPDHREQLLADLLCPVETALDDIPALAVNPADAGRLRQGQAVLVRGRDAPVFEGIVCAKSQGALVALGEIERGAFHPKRVFNLSAPKTGAVVTRKA